MNSFNIAKATQGFYWLQEEEGTFTSGVGVEGFDVKVPIFTRVPGPRPDGDCLATPDGGLPSIGELWEELLELGFLLLGGFIEGDAEIKPGEDVVLGFSSKAGSLLAFRTGTELWFRPGAG